jgi:predicted permease
MGLLQDLRYALRTLTRAPGFTAVVVLTVALGIGVNTAIFGFIDQLLLRPLPFPDSGRLAALYWRDAGYPTPFNSISYPVYQHIRDHNTSFAGVAAYDSIQVNLDTDTVSGEIVSANYFAVLGVRPLLGRDFRAEEDQAPGRNPVAMISAELWRSRFHSDPTILGRTLPINGVGFTVIGVVPAGFTGLELSRRTRPSIWMPLMMYPVAIPSGATSDLQHRADSEWLSAIARLKPGVTLGQSSADYARLLGGLKPRTTAVLIPANDARFPLESRNSATSFLAMLMAVVGLVLLIVCANVASLMLARAVKRQREIAVRLALGAGRARLAQQLVTEGLVLSLAGGAAGCVVAIVTAAALSNFQPFGVRLEAELDWRTLVFNFTLAILTGVLFGLLPLRQIARPDVPSRSPRGSRARNALVVAQVALSLVLLSGAVLFVRTLRNAQSTDPTRDPEHILLLNLNLRPPKYDAARGARFFDALLDRLHSIPGVRNAAYVYVVPFGGRGGARDVALPDGKPLRSDYNAVSSEYFDTVGLPILRGRAFDPRDRAGALNVAIVNEQFARRYWPGEDPLGKQLLVQRPSRLVQVVGVVRDGRFRGYRAIVNPCFYMPLAQSYESHMSLEVRTAGNPAGILAPLRREIRDLDKDMLISEIQTLRTYRDAGLGQERLSAALLSGLGALAALIAAIGLYGVMAFAVAQSTREIGIRMALGAASADVRRGVVFEALALVGVGLAIGLAAALFLSRFVSSLLYEVSPTDPAVYATTAAILIAVGALAAYLPARRASKVDPMVALRYE